MGEMKDRIARVRKLLGLSQRQFGERIGVQRGTVTNYELGRNIPTETVRQMICREFGVRREWLETGGGEMFESGNRYEQLWKMSENYLQDENEVFRRNLIAVIAELSGEELAILAGIAEKTLEKEIRRRKRLFSTRKGLFLF